MFYIICFDISDDRVRSRVNKVLKGAGYRVQKSVFECPNLTEKRFLKIKDRLEALIDHGEDSVRYYQLCRSCLKEVELSGPGELPQLEKFVVL
ncbi:MAG: CRISPR-associated endonuclease Cas2 [Desulfobulbaceae bacterium]|nr:CRISPR-associated endonuclease Cas2 [Desulfobulbaceae bacterium]